MEILKHMAFQNKVAALLQIHYFVLGNETVWTQAGVTDWKHLDDKVKKHDYSISDIDSARQVEILRQLNTEEQLNCIYHAEVQKRHQDGGYTYYPKEIKSIKFYGALILALSSNETS